MKQAWTESTRTRPTWDEYFMSIAKLSSERSSCDRLHVGCVLAKDNRCISMGYNGFLAGLPHTSIVRHNHEQATVHAEQNAITDSAKRGVSIDGATAYITHYPCLVCAKLLTSSGIAKIVYENDYNNDPLVAQILEGHVEILKRV
uniref:CMP/dCMP-type deaminase domain-containing protein n=1 Tax=viral metagenome TaxID=1070528 RepID=A0A6C0CJH7_9ZZZZ